MSKIQKVRIHLLPDTVESENLDESCAIVVDVFRASTTIVYALANGATKIIPVRTPEHAKSLAAKSSEHLLLAGELDAVKLEGFELGNSPLEYSHERINGRGIILTTTNGTAALSRVTSAHTVIIGCFANLSAAIRAAEDLGGPIHIVCAGVRRRPSLEDTLAAGAIARMLVEQSNYVLSEDDQTIMVSMMTEPLRSPEAFETAARRGSGAQHLSRLGFGADIGISLSWDSHMVVPRLSHNDTLYDSPIITVS